MKKSKFILMVGVLSLTLLSFTSENNNDITQLGNGNYLIENVDFSSADEAALAGLENSSYAGFFVRCYGKCRTKFTHATIAGRGCCTSQVSNATAEEIASADGVRDEVDRIMRKYMN